MRKILGIIVLFSLCVTALNAQEYLQIVTFETAAAGNATFTSAGHAEKKKELDENAVKSLFHTLFFQGVDGVNDGKPLVTKPNPMYTNSFFNSQARYAPYVLRVNEVAKPQKVGTLMQGTMRITIRLDQLIRDVRTNTGYQEKAMQERRTVYKPTIIVVPFKKTGEDYASILENNEDIRVAVGSVQRGFENAGIKTVDLQGRIDGRNRRTQYEENAGAAESNDRELLLSSGADVYVTVDFMKDVKSYETRLDLQLKAYEITSGTLWGAENGWAKSNQRMAMEELCFHAIKRPLPSFLEQIEKNYSDPVRAAIQISISQYSVGTLLDTNCSNGENVMEFIENWLIDHAHESQYNIRGAVEESAIIEDILIPRQDKKGQKMTVAKFARMLNRELKNNGISGVVRLEGNNVVLMLDL